VQILSSQILSSDPARTGVRLIFQHTADVGLLGPFVEQRPSGADHNALVTAHGANLVTLAAESEHERNVSTVADGSAPSFQHTTQAQFLVRLRVAYAASTGIRACLIGRWFHLENLTDATLRTLFGIVQNQVAGLRTKFSNQNSLVVSVVASNGVYP
jgi:hypothetical protein